MTPGFLLLFAFGLAVYGVIRNVSTQRRCGRLEMLRIAAISSIPFLVMTGFDMVQLLGGGRLGNSEALLGLSSLYALFVAYPFYQRVCWRVNDAGAPKAVAWLSLIPLIGLLPILYLLIVRPRPLEIAPS